MTTIAVAQYLRMSTEHQQYSAENQSFVISQYATSQGFSIVRTYSDPARSGLWLRNRAGLRELLRDVATGEVSYRAVLVYDVSRWGRFQDTDESAHYEFLCKSAGVPVHYCAEPFPNDGSMFSLITKNMKRLMAAEYSRELGTKVLAGQKRLAQLGFKQGGPPGYGFRRLLISADGTPKQELASGERKSIATDRVVLIPGPKDEVEQVRKIFSMFAIERRSIRWIVKDLNTDGIPFQNNRPWSHHVLGRMLSHPKYIGCNVFNRQTMRLGSHRVAHNKPEWVLVPGAHEGIVDPAVFAKAQNILDDLTIRKTDEQVLESLRSVLRSEGRLSPKIVEAAPGMVSLSTLHHRFGGIRQAYRLIGYDPLSQIPLGCSVRALRKRLLTELQAMFPEDLRVISGGKWRSWLKFRDDLIVRVLVAPMATRKSWRVDASKLEQQSITLLARVNAQGIGFHDFYILPKIEKAHLWLQFKDSRLEKGIHLNDLSQFCRSAWLLARKGEQVSASPNSRNESILSSTTRSQNI